jgi:hypothetical protein
MLVRSDEGVGMAGQSAALPFDVSPVQMGMRGSFEGRAFEVIGRIRWGWTNGSWNEWLLLFGDGSSAWLGEAMGQFMLTWERPLSEIKAKAVRDLAAGRNVAIGTEALIDDAILIVADAREARCIAAEGELPFTAPPGWTIFSVDFRSTSGRCASLQRGGGEVHFYDGRYVTLAELAPAGLRRIEGWQAPAYGR